MSERKQITKEQTERIRNAIIALGLELESAGLVSAADFPELLVDALGMEAEGDRYGANADQLSILALTVEDVIRGEQ